MQITEIGFNHSKAGDAEFEIFELASLHQRSFTKFHPDRPNRVSFFILIYIEQGTGVHMVDFEEYAFAAGSFIFIQREQVHAFDFSSKPEGKVLVFTQAFLDQVHANMRLPNYTPTHLNHQYSPLVALEDNDSYRCQVLMKEIMTETGHSQSDPLIIMYLFSTLSLMLHRLRPILGNDNFSQQQSKNLARFLDLLFVHFNKIRDAHWYAQQINSTYKTLNQTCKIATKLTVKQLIDAYTIIEIKRRLIVGSMASQQVAYDFGFEDSSNFVKYFKKHTNLTPSQFQKKYMYPQL